jgi:hypothetical protein
MPRLALTALFLCLAGCGSTPASDDSGGVKGGNSFGATLPELDLWGYIRHDTTGLATDTTLGPVTFDAIRQSTDKKHAVIHVSGFTCSACKTDAVDFALAYPSHADKAIFVELIADGDTPKQPATEPQLDAWITVAEISFTTAIDLPGVGPRILKDFSPAEVSYLVDLETLTILQHEQEPSALYSALDAL